MKLLDQKKCLPLQIKAGWLKLALFCLMLCQCQPSAFLTKRYVDYNFTQEGFLSPYLLQSIGRASYQSAIRGARADKALCLELARRKARRRMLRIMLHIRFVEASKLEGLRTTASVEKGADALSIDYPFHFQARELAQAEIAFAALLRRAFTALEDSRRRGQCMLVYRLEAQTPAQKEEHRAARQVKQSIISEIRAVRIPFPFPKH